MNARSASRRSLLTLSRALLATIAAAAIPLAATAASWRDHARPFDFKFGNHIDSHQQTMKRPNGELFGFLYIKYTGAVTTDGLRVARHVDCGMTVGCTAGWQLRGLAAEAKLLYHPDHDHPVWLIDRRSIPQPGAYTHFHWAGTHPAEGAHEVTKGYLLELKAIDTFCFVHGDSDEEMRMPADSCSDIGGLRVAPGIDTSTHTNIVTSEPNGSEH